jgi:hypothetical protein
MVCQQNADGTGFCFLSRDRIDPVFACAYPVGIKKLCIIDTWLVSTAFMFFLRYAFLILLFSLIL